MFHHPETDHELEFVKIIAYPSDAEQFKDASDRDDPVKQLE